VINRWKDELALVGAALLALTIVWLAEKLL